MHGRIIPAAEDYRSDPRLTRPAAKQASTIGVKRPWMPHYVS
jgi:hypothetical protein